MNSSALENHKAEFLGLFKCVNRTKKTSQYTEQ
jgi:hypothetical protein